MTTSHDSLLRHMEALRQLARSPSWQVGTQRAGFEALAVVAARTLDVARVSVWLYGDERRRLDCAELYESAEDRHSTGDELGVSEYPHYFAALTQAWVVDACDAMTDSRTEAFSSGYLQRGNIDAMLDAPIFVGGECVGVVCHEHSGGQRTWTPEEKVFAGAMGDFAALVLETSQRRAAEEMLQKRDEELRRTLAAATVGVWSWLAETNELDWTGEVERMFGLAPGQKVDLQTAVERLHPDDREHLEQSMVTSLENLKFESEVEFRVVWPDGSVHWLASRAAAIVGEDGTALGLRGTTIDVTEHKRMEEQLRRSQKLEGIGRLAGGIAHDFNNLLTVVRCSVSALRSRVSSIPRALQHLDNIDQSSRRAGALVSQLLTFARKQPQRPRRVELGELIRGTTSVLGHLIAAPIHLEVVTAPEPMVVRADPAYLEQILLDLTLNARDAMPGGGDLRVATSRHGVDELRAAGWELGSEHEGGVILEVSDTGVGIPEHLLPRIFEPFFTTKEIGAGSGMGLSSTYGVVQQAGGDIRVRSTVGAGTTFEVMWPLAPSSEVVEDDAPGAEPAIKTILLIEDEELIRNVAGIILRDAGYGLLSASTGEDALELARAADASVDLILTDVVLPGIRGSELVRRLRELHPDASVLYVSGYAENPIDDPTVADTHFLAKPFNPDDLLAKLAEVFAGSQR